MTPEHLDITANHLGADLVSIDSSLARLVSRPATTAGNDTAGRASRRRAGRDLRPAEAMLLTRYRDQLSGNVLELGASGDGLTEILCRYAASYTGVATSELGAQLCASRYPDGFFPGAGVEELLDIPGGIFDVIVAGRGTLDRLSAADRALVLVELPRLLAPGGLLIFSTYNELPEPRPLGVAGAFTRMESVDGPVWASIDWEIYLVAELDPAGPRGWALLDAELV